MKCSLQKHNTDLDTIMYALMRGNMHEVFSIDDEEYNKLVQSTDEPNDLEQEEGRPISAY